MCVVWSQCGIKFTWKHRLGLDKICWTDQTSSCTLQHRGKPSDSRCRRHSDKRHTTPSHCPCRLRPERHRPCEDNRRCHSLCPRTAAVAGGHIAQKVRNWPIPLPEHTGHVMYRNNVNLKYCKACSSRLARSTWKRYSLICYITLSLKNKAIVPRQTTVSMASSGVNRSFSWNANNLCEDCTWSY